MIRVVLFCLLALGLPAQILPAQILKDQYIVELSTEPVARMAGRLRVAPHQPNAMLGERRETILAEQGRIRRSLEASGARVLGSLQVVHNALVVRMSADRAERARTLAGVRSVRPVRMYQLLLDHALPLQKVPDAWSLVGGFEKAGSGVKIAVIDTGIDVTHPAFANLGLTAPESFPKGEAAYTNGKVIVARSYTSLSGGKPSPPADVRGHGTGVAMIAAGWVNTGPYGSIAGVAPGAYLGNYKIFPDSGSGAPDSAIMLAIEDAVKDGMDVLNLSLGSFPATRPQDDVLVYAVESAVAAGKIVTIAAGNDGPGPNTIASPATAPNALSVGSSDNDRSFAVRLMIDGRDPYLGLPGDGPNSSTPVTAPIVDITRFDSSSLGCGSYPPGVLSGSIALISRGTCYFEDKINNAQKAGAVGVILYARANAPDPIPFAAGSATLPALMISNGSGMALRDDLAKGALTGTLDFAPFPVGISSARISGFSSLGPSADYSIKPDLLAVGDNISTAQPVSAGGWVVEGGTSFSAPTVAGAAALLMSARPGLTAQQYRSLLVNSTTVFASSDGTTFSVQRAGSGVLNMAAALQNPITAAPLSLGFGVGGTTPNATRTLTLTNTGTAPDTFSVTVQALAGETLPGPSATSVQLDPGQSREVTVQFSGTGLNTGVYEGYIQIQGTQSNVAGRVPYWYGIATQSARYFQLLDAPASVRRGVSFDIAFRVLDANGLPVTQGLRPSILSGATATGIDSTDEIVPGSFVIHVQAPAARGTLTLQFQIDGVSAIDPVSVQVQ